MIGRDFIDPSGPIAECSCCHEHYPTDLVPIMYVGTGNPATAITSRVCYVCAPMAMSGGRMHEFEPGSVADQMRAAAIEWLGRDIHTHSRPESKEN